MWHLCYLNPLLLGATALWKLPDVNVFTDALSPYPTYKHQLAPAFYQKWTEEKFWWWYLELHPHSCFDVIGNDAVWSSWCKAVKNPIAEDCVWSPPCKMDSQFPTNLPCYLHTKTSLWIHLWYSQKYISTINCNQIPKFWNHTYVCMHHYSVASFILTAFCSQKLSPEIAPAQHWCNAWGVQEIRQQRAEIAAAPLTWLKWCIRGLHTTN